MNKSSLISSNDVIAFKLAIANALNLINIHAKTVLFIQPYGSTLSLIKRGIINGYNIIIFTANTDLCIVPNFILEMAHLNIQVDTANEMDMFNAAQQINNSISIHAVIPGFEYFVPMAASISEKLGLHGIHVNNVMKLRNKAIMRYHLDSAGITIPKYMSVSSFADLDTAIREIGFPAICKPVDAAGSVYVKKVNNKEEAFHAAMQILQAKNILWGYLLSPQLLYEQYIEGKEYSVEGIIIEDKIVIFSITEKIVADEVEFIEIGHIVNSPIDIDLKHKIENYVKNVIAILQANYCPFHAELRINQQGQPVLMEIAARLPGDKIGDLITYASGVNYFDYVYHAYLGQKYELTSLKSIAFNNYVAGIRFFYRPSIDKFTQVTGVNSNNYNCVEEINLYYRENDTIPAFPKPLRRLGHVIVKHHDYAEVVKTLQLIDDSVVFT